MHLFLSAGEPSGDQHAAHLLTELGRRSPRTYTCTGYGGPDLAAAGQDQRFRLTDLAVMGVRAVLPHYRQFMRLRDEAAAYFRDERPDAAVLVDFPGFHWHLARAAKAAGVPVIYYLPPQMWAWAPWRVRKVRKYVDHLICGLPFEPAWYADRGVGAGEGPGSGIGCEYTGHPFFDEAAAKTAGRGLSGRTTRRARTVGVLPGSRDREVATTGPRWPPRSVGWPACTRTSTFRVAAFKPGHAATCGELFAGVPNVEICVGKTSEVIELAECCLFVSGSVSLELFARRTPGVMAYQTSRLSYWVLEKLIVSESITLPNLFAGEMFYPEFFPPSADCPEVTGMVRQLDNWLTNPAALAAVRLKIEAAAARTVKPGAAANAADAVLRAVGGERAMVRAAA